MSVLSHRKLKFSIAMATYNADKYLEEQLESISLQTRKPDELVIFDDGSTDRTLDICSSFARSAPFPVEIRQNVKNLGFGDNFLTCAEACGGDWVFFCDQDDVWAVNKIEAVETAIAAAKDDLVLVFHNASVVLEDLTPLGDYLPETNFDVCAPANTKPPFWFVGGCVMCFRADLLDIVQREKRPIDYHDHGRTLPVRMAHDKWMCYLASAAGTIGSITDVLIQYRRHQTATTSVSKKKTLSDRLGRLRADKKAAMELERFCREVSDCFHSIANGRSSHTFEKDAQMYEELASLFAFRAKVYLAPARADRLDAFRKMYFTTKKSKRVAQFFSWKRAMKDLSALAGRG